MAGDRGDEVADALMLVFSGHLAMRLRPGPGVPVGVAREVARLLVEHPERIGRS